MAAHAAADAGGARGLVRDPGHPTEGGIELPGVQHRVTAGAVHLPAGRFIVAAGVGIVCVAILLLTHGYNFYFDELDFILAAPDWTWSSYLQPHNEHPVIIPRLIYAALLNTAGLRTYLPAMAVLLLLHWVNVVLVFELVRRRSGDIVGLGAAALLVFLGA